MRMPVLIGSVVLLAACMGGGRQTNPVAYYDFGVPTVRMPVPALRPNLSLEVVVPAWLDSGRLHYRLVYADPQRIFEYTVSRWAEPPGRLLGRTLRHRLGVGKTFPAQGASCRILVEIGEFSQIFDTPALSRGLVLGTLTVYDSSREILATGNLTISRPALTADAQGGVTALTEAANEFGEQLSRWLGEQGIDPGKESCRT